MEKIIVIGGGAGGLELVTRLSRSLGKCKKAHIILVDRSRTHVWKPLLHEVAAGVIDKQSDGVEYGIHASRHGYEFQLGNVNQVDAHNKSLHLDPLLDDDGAEILPARTLTYDTLVIAAGSMSNDFGTPGVAEHAYFLDSLNQAERFHRALLNQLLKNDHEKSFVQKLRIAIVGGGATGTELAAQLHYIGNLAKSYGMPNMSADRLSITIIEAGPRILPALPLRISNSAKSALFKINIEVKENTKVSEATSEGFVTDQGVVIPADLMVWAAGVKAPQFVQNITHVEHNRLGQIIVNEYLQAPNSDDLYVIGDSCGVELEDGSWVPPRAQSAHQMASTVATNLINADKNKAPKPFKYVDYGSLVHFSKYSTVGSLMGKLSNNNMFVEGRLAKLVYVSLYTFHLLAVHGKIKGVLTLMSRKVSSILGPKFKLH
ncbi:NAD(P)/FAD-dependent oxidoreductase [Algibacillus agarilyticus]|uniref:NAD(P)/FAD-dependent oxidoreductase n=1 Tax=Algibacillus agarilyticus TaxID=2234133 RepID=UPI000DD08442|nr:NAD(P)/FAD-dependent oxidoreductase [Algibacillus agarilyticus]